MPAKYSALTAYLKTQPARTRDLKLSFTDIEKIIGAHLPNRAYLSREWWKNRPHLQRQPHANAWTDAGFIVKEVHPVESKPWVRFGRSESA